jgi:lipoprotein-releasing system ATP-binding protein
MNNSNELELKNLTKNYESNEKVTPVLKEINYKFTQGSSYAITGASGSGKSTLLHLVAGIDKPTAGAVLFNEKNIFMFDKEEEELFRTNSIGLMFQFHFLIPELSIIENIVLAGRIKKYSKKESTDFAKRLLSKVDLESKANSLPQELSGGEQQRAALARAIVGRPSFLLADEPTGNLDRENANNVSSLILECQKEWGMGTIICTHDEQVWSRMDFVLRI